MTQSSDSEWSGHSGGFRALCEAGRSGIGRMQRGGGNPSRPVRRWGASLVGAVHGLEKVPTRLNRDRESVCM